MAIHHWIENGKTHYKINVCIYGQDSSSVRKQKQQSGTLDDTNPVTVLRRLERIESEIREKLQRAIIEKENAGITWGDLVQKWAKAIQVEKREEPDVCLTTNALQKRKDGTLNTYLHSVLDFTTNLNKGADIFEDWTDMPAVDITPADIEQLFKKMARVGYSNARQYNVKVAISQCFRFGIMRRLLKGVTVSPTYGFGISRKESKRPEILNVGQVDKLLFEAKRQNHDWKTIWEGCYHLGFRSGEGYELRAKDVDLGERMVYLERQYNITTRTIEGLKDGEWRQVPINDDLYELFTELGVDKMGPEDYVFPRITAWKHGEAARHLRAFCERIEVPSICMHTLRACWATHLIKNGVDLITVQKLGGWSDIDTMQRYIRLAGIEVKGSTDSLSMRKKERPARVLKLLGSANG